MAVSSVAFDTGDGREANLSLPAAVVCRNPEELDAEMRDLIVEHQWLGFGENDIPPIPSADGLLRGEVLMLRLRLPDSGGVLGVQRTAALFYSGSLDDLAGLTLAEGVEWVPGIDWVALQVNAYLGASRGLRPCPDDLYGPQPAGIEGLIAARSFKNLFTCRTQGFSMRLDGLNIDGAVPHFNRFGRGGEPVLGKIGRPGRISTRPTVRQISRF